MSHLNLIGNHLIRCTTRRCTPLINHNGVRNCSVNLFSEGKTVLQHLNTKIPGILGIKSYNEIGFRLTNDIFVVGPCVLFPTKILAWNVKDHTSINEKSLSLFHLIVPKVDILILGAESEEAVVKLLGAQMFLNSKGINVELLRTHLAIETYNFLVSEGRNIAAALIPPLKLPKDSSFNSMRISSPAGHKVQFQTIFDRDPHEDEFVYAMSSHAELTEKFKNGIITREELRDKMREVRKNCLWSRSKI